jgi:hypothetical protein
MSKKTTKYQKIIKEWKDATTKEIWEGIRDRWVSDDTDSFYY